MDKKRFSLKHLEKALASLERAVAQPKNEFNRDSVIQRFEFTFELPWKALRKVLEFDKPIADPSVRGILREAAQLGYLSNLEIWFQFQEARNLTSHTYDESTAEEVYKIAIQLPGAAHSLLNSLKNTLKYD